MEKKSCRNCAACYVCGTKAMIQNQLHNIVTDFIGVDNPNFLALYEFLANACKYYSFKKIEEAKMSAWYVIVRDQHGDIEGFVENESERPVKFETEANAEALGIEGFANRAYREAIEL